MPAQEYNFREIFRIAFGAIPYNRIDTTRKVNEAEPYSSIESSTFQSTQMSKLLGTPLFMTCKLDGFQLPNEPVIEINGGQNIIKTLIDTSTDPRDRIVGTFKEMFSQDDYKIIIRGVAVLEDGTDEYPEEQIKKIRELSEKQSNIKIECTLATIFNIPKIVIESCSFPGVEGAPGFQPYQLNCLSDFDFNIELQR
jgi:hypothetical protein